MSKLWPKSGASQLNKAIEEFDVGEDYILDRKLLEFDLLGSLAHGKMLSEIGILTEDEYEKIKAEFKVIREDFYNGNFEIKIEDEDIHSKVENRLTEKLGDIGKKIHTGRSRNDQVLVDTRLYTKKELLTLRKEVLELCITLLGFAKEYQWIPLPGYTHMQLGMPSSLGMWAGAFVESLIDELSFLDFACHLNDQCPLGSGAGYGVSIPLKRDRTAELLAFKRMQVNSMYCGNSRGKIEANIISAISSLSMVFNKMATDLLLFTTKEFDFFEVTEAITTGSSIMPQKKNLDVLELIRAKSSSLLGLETSIKSLISSLPSGYNRDFQDTKKFLMNAFDTVLPIAPIMTLIIESLKPKEDKLVAAHKSEIYATDAAYDLVEKGMTFRDAYRHVGTHLDELDNYDPYKVIKKRSAIGSTGNLQLDHYELIIADINEQLVNESRRYENKLLELWD